MKLRDKIFMTKVQFAEKEAMLGEDKILLRQPTLADRNEIYRLSSKMDVKKGEMEVDLTKLQIYTIIKCAYDPETEQRIFEIADFKELSESALGTYIVNNLSEAATELLEVELNPKKQDKK